MEKISTIVVFFLLFASTSPSSLLEKCLFCTERDKVFLKTLYPFSKFETLCIKNTDEIPHSSSIITFSACKPQDCLCVHEKKKRVLNKKTICSSGNEEGCTWLKVTSKSNSLSSCHQPFSVLFLIYFFLLLE